MQKLSLNFIVVLVCLTCLTYQAAGDADIVLNRTDFQASVCNIESMRVEFSIITSDSEPLIRSRMQWIAGPNTAVSCLSTLTNIHVEALSPDNTRYFIKLNTNIPASGQISESTSVISPRWNALICHSTDKVPTCLTATEAQEILPELLFRELHVTGKATMAYAASKTQAREATGTGLQAFDSLFSDFDEEPTTTPQAEEENNETEPAAEDPAALAEEAVRQVSSLLATSLAQYSTPPHACESTRYVSNWVRISSTCQISFRRESNHNYLCADDKNPKKVLRSEKVDVDFSRDLQDISELRYNAEGAAIMVLRLKDRIVSVEDQYKVDRWQFVAAQHVAEDMRLLLTSFTTIRDYCENQT